MTSVELVWPNKDKVLTAFGETGYRWTKPEDAAQQVPLETAAHVGEASADAPNMVVCGDALDAISALSGTPGCLEPGSVRLLYIDPPFNTGRSFGNYDDALQTASWLSMFRDRLQAIKPYLSPDASIWVHLDDSETHRARCILDEVFGADAFVATVVWQKRTTRESRAAFSSNHDSVHVYAPAGPRSWKKRRNLLTKDAATLKNRDNDPRGPWGDAPFTAPGYRANQQYPVVTPSGRVLKPPRGRSWYATAETYRGLLADDRIWFPKNGDGSPRIKLFAHQLRGLVPFSVWGATETGTNDDAKRHLQTLFPTAEFVFSTPKPEELLERIIHISTDPGELVVDFFAGSGTTAAVAHKMGRRWIAIERSPATVMQILHPRLEQVLTGTDRGGISRLYGWKGGGGYTVSQARPRAGRVAQVRIPATLVLKRRSPQPVEASAS